MGDDAQSIYAFRADFSNLDKFTERVPNSEMYRLEDNYRPIQEILNISNQLLEKSPLDYKKQLRAIRGVGDLSVIMNFENEFREAEWVACEILENSTKEGFGYDNHLILVRSSYLSAS